VRAYKELQSKDCASDKYLKSDLLKRFIAQFLYVKVLIAQERCGYYEVIKTIKDNLV